MSPLGVPPSTVAGKTLEGYRTGGRAHQEVDRTSTSGWRPFALEPLRQELSRQVGDHIGLATLAPALGVHERQVHRWAHGGLTEVQADELAARLGCHPAEVWPNWWIDTARYRLDDLRKAYKARTGRVLAKHRLRGIRLPDDGWLRRDQAERCARRVGLDPAEVWPGWSTNAGEVPLVA